MPLTTLDEIKIQRLDILSPDGTADASLMPDIPRETMLEMYRIMVLARVFDERAFKLQRQGRLGTYPQIIGQEASQCIPALCINKEDWLVPTYRGQGAYFARGMDLANSLLYWGGDDRGTDFPKDNNDFMFAIPVASHLTHAVGLAWAAKLQNKDQVALCWLGDGASSKGDLHEAMNFTGVYDLPVVFLIENNQWAISVPRKDQSKAKTLAQRGWGLGLQCLQVDGNDPFAIYKAVGEAVARGRRGEGGSVIELVTYRMGHHTTADDATRYRSDDEVKAWEAKSPILRLRRYLEAKGLLDAAKIDEVQKDCERKVQAAIDRYENVSAADPFSMFDNMYAKDTWVVAEQRKEFAEILKTRKEQLEMSAPMPEGRFP